MYTQQDMVRALFKDKYDEIKDLKQYIEDQIKEVRKLENQIKESKDNLL